MTQVELQEVRAWIYTHTMDNSMGRRLRDEIDRLTNENTCHSTQLDRAREEIQRLRELGNRNNEKSLKFGDDKRIDAAYYAGYADGMYRACDAFQQGLKVQPHD